MANSNENLKVLTPNDSQETLTAKSNFNFGKLLDLIGVADIGSEFTLLPGLKGDKGDDGIRGSTVFTSTSSPAYGDNNDPLENDLNYDNATSIISIYNTSGTTPEWETVIDIHQLVVDEVSNISLEAALAIFVDDTDLIVYPGNNSTPFVPSNQKYVIFNNFDIKTQFETQYDKFKEGTLSIFTDTNESAWGIVMGATPQTGTVTLPNLEDSLKIKMSNRDAEVTATAFFDLSFISDPTLSQKHTGFNFKTTKLDSITPSNSKQIQVLIGSGGFLNASKVAFITGIDGIATYSSTKVMQIGINNSTNFASIYTDATNTAFHSNIIPSAGGTYSLGTASYKFLDLHLSRNIETSDIFIGDSSHLDGLSITNGKVAVNINADDTTSTFTINGDMSFTHSEGNQRTIKADSAITGDGTGILIIGGDGVSVSTGVGGDGGALQIRGGSGGNHSTGGVAGRGGDLILSGGDKGETTGNEPNESSTYLSDVLIGCDAAFNYISNVGIQTDNAPIHSFEIGRNMGYSIEVINSNDTGSGEAIIYAISNESEVAMTFNISTSDYKDGRILTIKDVAGNGGTYPISVSSSAARFDLATGGALAGTITINQDYGYVTMFFRYNGTANVWHIISHQGVDFT